MPSPKGHYSQVIEHNGLLYVSGQLPVDPISGKVPEGIGKQTSLVLEKIEKLLKESGSSREKVIQMRIYISDIALWDEVNRIYAGFFADHRPVRCIVPVKELHYGCLIEVEATAVAK